MMKQGLWYCGNIVVITFLCLNITFLSATGAPIPGLHILDISFDAKLQINNRTVKCSGKVQGSVYPSPMYTCNEISVDDQKLYHGYATDGSRNREGCSTGCPCGNNRGQPNDIHALCTAMLKAQGVTETLTAAYVVKPSCAPGNALAKRVKLYRNENGGLVWEDVLAPNGYINMLQCLTTNHVPIT